MADCPQRKRVFRFSIAALLFLMLCLGGYLSAYRVGFNAGKVAFDSSIMIRRVYPIGDLVASQPTAGANPADYDFIIDRIVSTVAPSTWMAQGSGEGEIQPFPANLSLVVSQNNANHAATAALLERLRRLQPPKL
jgi:hypothetical protein